LFVCLFVLPSVGWAAPVSCLCFCVHSLRREGGTYFVWLCLFFFVAIACFVLSCLVLFRFASRCLVVFSFVWFGLVWLFDYSLWRDGGFFCLCFRFSTAWCKGPSRRIARGPVGSRRIAGDRVDRVGLRGLVWDRVESHH